MARTIRSQRLWPAALTLACRRLTRPLHNWGGSVARLLVVSGAFVAAAAASTPVLVERGQQALLFRPEVRQRAADLVALSDTKVDASRLGSALRAIGEDPELAPAMRDAILYQYLQRLRGRPSEQIPEEALDWLVAYRAQAERLHEESSVARLPLFDVATAAQGLRHEKRHRQASERMLAADEQATTALLDGYRMQDDPPWRGGIEDAIGELPRSRLDWLAQQIEGDSELVNSVLAVRVHLARIDVHALTSTLVAANADVASEGLQRALQSLPADRAFALAEGALDHPDAGVRGLAIALASAMAADDARLAERWHPRLRGRLILPDDGVAAALHLARGLSMEQIDAWAARAGDDPVLLRRWQLVRHFAQLSDLHEAQP